MSQIKTALIVDDSIAARMLLRSILEQLRPGWATVLATDGADALEKTKAAPAQVMFIDINMPGIDGFELSEKLRERFPRVPIALVTTNIQEKVRDRAAERNLQFIGKPITRAKVEAFVDSLDDLDD